MHPENVDGKSLLGLLENPDEGGHEQLAFINVYGAMPTRSLTCITQQHKYTYWWYGDETMEPMEELFDTKNDSLETINLADDAHSKDVLYSMRERYDVELSKWKSEAVDYNDYQRFGTLFDRNVSMSEKQSKLKKKGGKPKNAKRRKRNKQKKNKEAQTP